MLFIYPTCTAFLQWLILRMCRSKHSITPNNFTGQAYLKLLRISVAWNICVEFNHLNISVSFFSWKASIIYMNIQLPCAWYILITRWKRSSNSDLINSIISIVLFKKKGSSYSFIRPHTIITSIVLIVRLRFIRCISISIVAEMERKFVTCY